MELGFSTSAFLFGVFLCLLSIFLLFYYLIRNTGKPTVPRRRARDLLNAQELDEYYGNIENEEGVLSEDTVSTTTRRSEIKAKRKALRELEQETLKERAKKREEKEMAYQEKQLARERKRQEEDEKRRLEKEEREKREHEEYLRIKETIVIEQEGEDLEEQQDDETQTLTEFISFITETKFVEVDAIASRFDMTSSEVVDRIKDLLQSDQLRGFFDNRGKFIYVSDDDLIKISEYVNSRGRCSLVELSSAFGDILKTTS
ncbi:DDRGK domain-containing protein 1 [Thelohanellus kitauei]|uniref:DDRGK domain-containing protein 1 n=1 Tax=Thelohanellus kitauei TaxID=669202 RepID=A0A0C2ND36_THEKT|nr:DDRGK domain-containing protein 1 [Thelohanellus kitauei]